MAEGMEGIINTYIDGCLAQERPFDMCAGHYPYNEAITTGLDFR